MHSDRRWFAGAVAPVVAILSLARPSVAQQPDSAGTPRDTTVYRLSPLEVHGSIVPTAGPRIGSGVPARVTTVSRERIEAWEPRILPDVLAAQPGVSLYDDLGSPFKLNLSTRGFTAGPTVGLPPGVTVFLDGVRQNEADAQEVDFDLLPMEHVRRVELLSGTASLLGPNSLGGAINLITDRGSGPPHGEMELSGGSYGAYAGELSLSGTASDHWNYYASGGLGREGGWREGTGARNYNGFVNLGRAGDERGIRLQAFATRSRAETAGSLPESLFQGAPRSNFTAGDYEDLRVAQLSLSGYLPLGPGRSSFTAYVRRFDANRFNVNQPPDADVRGRTGTTTAGVSADWRWAPAVRFGTLALRGGLDGSANRVHARIFAVESGGGDESLTTDVTSPSYDVAAYGLADLGVGRFTLSAGARLDFVGVPFHDRLDAAENESHHYGRLSPRGGINVELARGLSAYASIGQSFRAPAILELACADPEAACPLPFALGDDPPLAPVRATTYEAGARWSIGSVDLSGSVYRSDVRDEIFFVASPQALLSGYFTNLERTRRSGVELSAQGTMGARASWYANYAYTSATFQSPADLFSIRSDDDFADSPLAGDDRVVPGDRLPLVPAHQVKAGGLVRPLQPLSLGVDLRYVGEQWLRGDEANETAPLPAYFVAGARAGVDLGPWELSAVVTNVLDAHDAVFGTFNENRRTGELERFLTPMGARSLKLTLRRRVGGRGDED